MAGQDEDDFTLAATCFFFFFSLFFLSSFFHFLHFMTPVFLRRQTHRKRLNRGSLLYQKSEREREREGAALAQREREKRDSTSHTQICFSSYMALSSLNARRRQHPITLGTNESEKSTTYTFIDDRIDDVKCRSILQHFSASFYINIYIYIPIGMSLYSRCNKGTYAQGFTFPTDYVSENLFKRVYSISYSLVCRCVGISI